MENIIVSVDIFVTEIKNNFQLESSK